jgi:pseudo-rSAM protein
MKTYWIYLEPYTFVDVKSNKLMLFNSVSGDIVEFKNSGLLKKLIRDLRNPDNMYCVKIDESIFHDSSISGFIQEIRKFYMGDIVDTSITKYTPRIMYPELNIQKSIKHSRKEKDFIKSLSEITIQLTGKCNQFCNFCTKTYLQCSFCTKNNTSLAYEDIVNIIEQVDNGTVSKIRFTGGNILIYEAMDLLVNYIKNKIFLIEWYIHLENIAKYASKLPFLKINNSTIVILVTFPIKKDTILMMKNAIDKLEIRYKWHFAVSDEDDILEIDTILDNYKIEDYNVIPYYNGENINFFSENIFIKKEDIYTVNLNKRSLFIQQTINTFDFGKLTVLSDKRIFANLNFPAIGTTDESLSSIVLREFTEGKSWLRIRDQHPCNKCVYQWLCPSPSNYELAIGKPNLCHINL